MRNLVSQGVFVVAGLLAAPCVTQTAVPEPKGDPRLGLLEKFFDERQCPVKRLSKEFLAAADRHGLDWRLLPSIAFVESGGGKAHRNNNIFGWDSARGKFASMREAIDTVARRLGSSKLYKNKSTSEILRTYNPRTDYELLVLRLMRQISPARHPILLSQN